LANIYYNRKLLASDESFHSQRVPTVIFDRYSSIPWFGFHRITLIHMF